MRVLHVISSLDSRSGGTSAAVIGLAAAQQRAGIEVTVVSTFRTGREDDPAGPLKQAGIRVRLVGPAPGPRMRHPDLRSTLRECIAESDIVHIHALWEEIQYQAGRLARRLGVPYLITPHGMLDPWSLRQSKWKKRIYLAVRLKSVLNHAAALHFTSRIECDAVAAMRLRPKSILEPIGVDLSEFEDLPMRGTFRCKYPVLAGRSLVLFLGRIHHGKGLELLIPAMGQIPGACLAIAGPDGDFRDEAERLISSSGLGERAVFTGSLNGRDKLAALADADLLALPSYHENFGIVVVEALAVGTPVVVSDQVNIWQEIRSAKVGAVVPLGIERLAAEIGRWLSDEALRSAASARAPEFVRRHYDWNEIARHWGEHYSALRSDCEIGVVS